MLCPCCGVAMPLGPGDCGCGARIVGEPLPESPFKVQRLGPAMIAVTVTIAVAASCRITPWMALGGFLAAWLSLRAVRLAKRDSDSFGGYRVACATLAAVLVAGTSLAAYEIGRIPRYLEKFKIRGQYTTQAAMLDYDAVLEAARHESGSYPIDSEAMKKVSGTLLPLDYWERPIMYVSYAESAAMYGPTDSRPGHPGDEGPLQNRSIADEPPGIEFQNFELRSAGPDGIFGTADDIVMRDGVFCTNPRVIKRPIDKEAQDR